MRSPITCWQRTGCGADLRDQSSERASEVTASTDRPTKRRPDIASGNHPLLSSIPSQARTQGPITTGSGILLAHRTIVFQQQRPRRMGPCVRRDDVLTGVRMDDLVRDRGPHNSLAFENANDDTRRVFSSRISVRVIGGSARWLQFSRSQSRQLTPIGVPSAFSRSIPAA